MYNSKDCEPVPSHTSGRVLEILLLERMIIEMCFMFFHTPGRLPSMLFPERLRLSRVESCHQLGGRGPDNLFESNSLNKRIPFHRICSITYATLFPKVEILARITSDYNCDFQSNNLNCTTELKKYPHVLDIFH